MIYAMSDLHGEYEKFLAMLEKSSFRTVTPFICWEIWWIEALSR